VSLCVNDSFRNLVLPDLQGELLKSEVNLQLTFVDREASLIVIIPSQGAL